MPRWIVCFDAAVAVSVEADSADEAARKARATLDAIELDNLRFSKVMRRFTASILIDDDRESAKAGE